ncbi:sulfite reductase flavoprotein subunit alpha [Stenotrophomonas hibiscicola]|uniref:sulfite reductase flavoprotein subunit alpha n=1 Tax=Stenotrophomonas hibiscicola TaxID=86189 RepID=UPI002E779AFC|nr:sulfite reductase flavoprotein subunit alpha [[Pseudomonas] hibiscicola]
MNALPTSTPFSRLLVGFASESGNARALAQRLGADLQPHAPQVLPFNDIDVASLGQGDVLLAISSSFGDGEPPANGERFFETLRQTTTLSGLRYAVFGLGDTGYPSFCGFTKALDAALSERQAQPLLHRVDADLGYEQFFQQWQPVLSQVLGGDLSAGQDLHLQVTAYGEDNAFAARILERRRLNSSDPAAWHLQLDIAGSGMVYRAGDTLHVVPENDPTLLHALARWYGDTTAVAALRDRELRLLSKSVLRELARLGGSETLKGLLKVSQKRELDAYLHGLDLLDVLQDHATPDSMPLPRLRELLSARLPRAYSIASHPRDDQLSLCVREVHYTLRGRERFGTATGSLLHGGDHARVYCRSNPGFHLPDTGQAPLLLVGTGTGIAPLMGLMQELQANGCEREVHLVFGEKHSKHDYLYRGQLQDWHTRGVLAGLHTAFSRDGTEKVYVQHVLRQRASEVRDVLGRGGHLYLCGNKRHLEGAVREAIDDIAGEGRWDALRGEGRTHCELY